MATVGAAGAGNSGSGNGGDVGGRGFGAGCSGGGIRGGRHGHGGGYGYNNNDDSAFFNGPRLNPNLGSHPPNYGPGWDYEWGRDGRHNGNGNRG
ncbi:uncharacterized protein [Miscanthus floridulus]|uniref:uncharacterized protein n=1 Tax=Miscanthus floridulus TaxID=154761 RepID=UPI0034578D4F